MNASVINFVVTIISTPLACKEFHSLKSAWLYVLYHCQPHVYAIAWPADCMCEYVYVTVCVSVCM